MAEPDTQETSSVKTEDPTSPEQSSHANVQKQIVLALAHQRSTQQADFSEELKQATGFSSIKALKDAQLAEQGKTEELLQSKSAELDAVIEQFHASQITSALLAASNQAIKPRLVVQLLAPQCQCDADGKVTKDGQPVDVAVAALLDDNPFMAKAEGSAGSGAPHSTAVSAVNPWDKDSFNLTEQVRIKRENPSLAQTLMASASI